MKNFLLLVLFVLASAGCGVSYMLLRMPQHDVTALIVKYLAVKPGEEQAVAEEPKAETEVRPEADPAAEPEAADAKEPVPEKPVAKDKDDGKEWKGFSSDAWYAGKRLSERDFRGKVTMVYAWSSKEKPSVEMLSRIEDIWSSFKHKPLVVVGSHRGGRNPKIPKAYKQLGLTFPMYEGAGFYKEPNVSSYPYIYIVNHHGWIVYCGGSDRSATEALVEALTACQLKQ